MAEGSNNSVKPNTSSVLTEEQTTIMDIMERCNKRDKTAVLETDIVELRKLFLRMPELIDSVGCMAQIAIDNKLNAVIENVLLKEAVMAKIRDMKRQLKYDESPELERLLIQQIALCWLNLYAVQSRCTNLDNDSHSLNVGSYWDKRLNSAQRRFLKAVESLSKLRKVKVQIELRESCKESAEANSTKRVMKVTNEQ